MFDDFDTQYQSDDLTPEEEEIQEEEKEKTYKQMFKKTGEELQEYLAFKKRGSVVRPRKGKGLFKRKPKYEDEFFD